MGKKNKNRSKYTNDSDDEVPIVTPVDNDDNWETPKHTNKKKNLFSLLDNNSDSDREVETKHVITPAPTPVDYFDIAYNYDEANDYENAIKNYKLCVNDRIALNNLGVIYWNIELDSDNVYGTEILDYFRASIKLNYKKAMYNFACYVSEHKDNLKEYKEEAQTYMTRYMLLKNADNDERQIINNLFTL